MNLESGRLSILSVLSFVFLSLFSVTSVTSGQTELAQVLNLGNGGEPKDLDPHVVTGVPTFIF